MKNFLESYVETALWSSLVYLPEDFTPSGDFEGMIEGDSMDEWFSINDIDEETLKEMESECDDFIALLVREGFEQLLIDDAEQVAHDFWLTRNDHGAGFWDGDYEQGDKLTELCKPYGSYGLWFDCEGKVYGN